jgi:hypothetical protein
MWFARKIKEEDRRNADKIIFPGSANVVRGLTFIKFYRH